MCFNFQKLIDSLPLFVESLAWPLVTLTIVWILKNDIHDVITRIAEAKFPWGSIAFGDSKADMLPVETTGIKDSDSTDFSSVHVDKFANLYWLANDIMWTSGALLRNGPRDALMRGFSQILHHLNIIGLADSEHGKLIAELNHAVLSEDSLTAEFRSEVASKLQNASYRIGHLLAGQQEGFDNGLGTKNK